MFEEKAQSYRVKDKEIYRVKLACQNTKVYRVNTQLTKGTITLLYFFWVFLHMRTLSVLDNYRANVLGPCRACAITLFTVFPWRVTNGQQSADCWQKICVKGSKRLSFDCRPTVGQLLADSFLGELFFIFSNLIVFSLFVYVLSIK